MTPQLRHYFPSGSNIFEQSNGASAHSSLQFGQVRCMWAGQSNDPQNCESSGMSGNGPGPTTTVPLMSKRHGFRLSADRLSACPWSVNALWYSVKGCVYPHFAQ